MVQRTFCDVCKKEIKGYSVNVNDITIVDDTKNICNDCLKKVVDFLSGIPKDKQPK